MILYRMVSEKNLGGYLFGIPDPYKSPLPNLTRQPYMLIVCSFIILIGPILMVTVVVCQRIHPRLILLIAMILAQVGACYTLLLLDGNNRLSASIQTLYSWYTLGITGAAISAYRRRCS